MINWQLSKQGIRWPVSPDRIAGSGVDPSRSSIFEVIRWQVTSFQMIAGSSLIFSIYMKYVVFYMCRTIKILISNWPRKLRFSQFLQAGKTCQLLLTFLTKVTRWSRFTANFYALIGQNLTGEFMRKLYAASWNLFTLTAEADRVLCQQLVMFLTVFFHWTLYKMKFSCFSLLLFMASLFIWFLVEKCVACQSRKSYFGWHRFRFSPCLMSKRVEKSEAILALLDSFQCISNGKPE